MRQRRSVGHVGQARFGQKPVGHRLGHRGGEHGADVDGHVEEAEGRIALGGVFRIVVEVAHHHLQIAFEKARADRDERQRGEHQNLAAERRLGGNRQAQVPGEHHGDTRRDAPSEADAVGQNAAHERHEVDGGQEDRVDLGRHGGREAEFRLQKEQEDGQHGVVAEPLAGVGEGQRIQTFGLSFEHRAD